ncbi:MAG: gluconate 2-dehydrogenase subunit 3 family protein [Thermomicrobiales bacterium]|nr:gluconate 2-dehydrogenase subunit 3 family protein [Thermomicrobiales bacterium]
MTKQPPAYPTGNRSIDRRRLLRDTSLVAGGAAVAGLTLPELTGASPGLTGKPVITLHQTASPAAPAASPVASPVPPAATPVDLDHYEAVALTAAEIETLKAATDRIFPPDDLGPSATEAGVFVYIDRALAGRYATLLPLYQEGLAALDGASEGGEFAALAPEAQDALLTQIEAGEIESVPAGFFGSLLSCTREGLFADPVHGGNQNFAGWDLIGYTGIRLLWTAENQALDVLPEPEHRSVAEYGGGS